MRLILLLACLISVELANGQEPERFLVSLEHSCSYIEAPQSGDLYAFKSSEQALEIINQICKAAGIQSTFDVHAANVANAKAIADNGRRIILYSESLVEKLNLRTNTNWAGVSILAHEIGHHINGHTLDENSTRPDLELAADQFSGFALRRLGASLEDAQMAVNTLCPHDGTSLYPPKSARLEAIAVGWTSAEPTAPSDPVSDDFKSFSDLFPVTLKARPEATYLVQYEGSGYITIKMKNKTIEISGQLNYDVKDHGDIYNIHGTFQGRFFYNTYYSVDNYPFKANPDIVGDLVVTRHGIVHKYSFDYLTFDVEGPTDIFCSLRHNDAVLDTKLISIPFKLVNQ